VNQVSSGCADDHQPRYHGPGAGMLCCQRPLVRSDARAVPRAQSSVHGRPCPVALAGDWEKPSIPTRSARTPLVVRPGHRRVENPTLPGAAFIEGCAFDDPTTCAPPPRRAGTHGPRPKPEGQGPHHPRFREEERDPPHPRCLPSVTPDTGAPDRALSSTLRTAGVGTSPSFTREWFCPQSVANLGTTLGALVNLAGPAALDGAAGRRPGCASCT